MSTQYRIDKGVPIPRVPRPRGSVTPEMARAESAARQREVAHAHKAKGFCTYGASCCYERPAEGHVLCTAHLVVMREASRVRTEQKRAAGLCRQCDSPAFAGMAFCLVHRQGKGLPLVVKQGIAAWRRLEAQREEAARRAHLYDNLHLLDERRQRIMRLRYPADGSEGKTLQEIGELLGVTRERVRQLEASAVLKIDKGIPIPGEARGERSEICQTLKAMQPGESFVCSLNERLAANRWAKHFGFIIVSRRQPDGHYRVWMASKDGANE